MQALPNRRAARLCIVLAFTAGAGVIAGCSRPSGSITGVVNYKGTNLKGGNVTFISTEGQPSNSGSIGEDGRYTVPSLTAGSYKVCVETASLKPPPGAFAPKAGAPKWKIDPNTVVPEGYTPSNPGDAAAVKNAKRYIAIPEQYADDKKTDLSYNFPGGDQTFDIELK